MAVELKVPSVGESISEVYIGEWLKQEGDSVEKDEPVVEVETDKATLEVNASVAGTISKVLKQQGDTAEVGEVIAHIEEGDGAGSGDGESGAEAKDEEDSGEAADEKADDDEAKAKPKQEQAETSDEQDEEGDEAAKDSGPAVMPAAQRLLDEHGVSADAVEGSGKDGRILKEDAQRYIDSQKEDDPDAKAEKSQKEAKQPEKQEAKKSGDAPAQTGDRQEEAVPMSPLRRTIARRLVEAQQNAALLTTFNEIDMSSVMALRNEYKEMFDKEYGIRLGFMSFFVKASIDALKRIPQLNAEIRDDEIIYKNYYDIAVAVSTKKGLVTPVIRNAERLSFAEVEKTIGDFGQRAQENKLSPDELQGGTFTISNGGVFGSLMSTPIVNPPQSGVLGMHAIQQRPVALDGEVVIRPMMYVALTYDHRIVDGREAVTFLKRIKEAVETPTRMLIEV